MQHHVLRAILQNPIPTNKPGVEPKRPPRPVNITTMVKLSPTVANHITVSWNTEYGRGYAIAVYLVRKLTSSELLQRLKTRGVRHSDFTRGLSKYPEFVSFQFSVVDVADIIVFPHMEHE